MSGAVTLVVRWDDAFVAGLETSVPLEPGDPLGDILTRDSLSRLADELVAQGYSVDFHLEDMTS